MATRLTLYRRSILTQYNARNPDMTDLEFCRHHKMKIGELECWKTLAATEVAEAVFAAKAHETKKKPGEKTSLFSSEIFSMVEVLSGRPEGEALFYGDTLMIERIRIKVMLQVASLSCTIKHMDHHHHRQDLRHRPSASSPVVGRKEHQRAGVPQNPQARIAAPVREALHLDQGPL